MLVHEILNAKREILCISSLNELSSIWDLCIDFMHMRERERERERERKRERDYKLSKS